MRESWEKPEAAESSSGRNRTRGRIRFTLLRYEVDVLILKDEFCDAQDFSNPDKESECGIKAGK
jgi:hypothetical protein